MQFETLPDNKTQIMFTPKEQTDLGVVERYVLPDQLPRLKLDLRVGAMGSMAVFGVHDPDDILSQLKRMYPEGK